MINALGFSYGPGAGVVYAAAIVTIFLYRLDAKSHAAIMRDLYERRAAALAGAAVFLS
jgi:Na+/melibiose symporter-like transporter